MVATSDLEAVPASASVRVETLVLNSLLQSPEPQIYLTKDSDPRFGPEPGWPHSLSGERNHLELGMASESCSGEAARLFARLLICRAVSYDSYVKYRIAELQVSAPSRVELSQCMQQARRCDAQAG